VPGSRAFRSGRGRSRCSTGRCGSGASCRAISTATASTASWYSAVLIGAAPIPATRILPADGSRLRLVLPVPGACESRRRVTWVAIVVWIARPQRLPFGLCGLLARPCLVGAVDAPRVGQRRVERAQRHPPASPAGQQRQPHRPGRAGVLRVERGGGDPQRRRLLRRCQSAAGGLLPARAKQNSSSGQAWSTSAMAWANRPYPASLPASWGRCSLPVSYSSMKVTSRPCSAQQPSASGRGGSSQASLAAARPCSHPAAAVSLSHSRSSAPDPAVRARAASAANNQFTPTRWASRWERSRASCRSARTAASHLLSSPSSAPSSAAPTGPSR
jgi:hypothetical protein